MLLVAVVLRGTQVQAMSELGPYSVSEQQYTHGKHLQQRLLGELETLKVLFLLDGLFHDVLDVRVVSRGDWPIPVIQPEPSFQSASPPTSHVTARADPPVILQSHLVKETP